MKLKKIMALALSGVLAVSMLAGCSGSGEKYLNVTPSDITKEVAAAMQDAPTRLTASSDTALDDILAGAVSTSGLVEVAGLTDAKLVACKSTGTISVIITNVLEIDSLADANANIDFTKVMPTEAGSKTGMALYAIKNSAADEDIAKLIAEEITGLPDANDDNTLNYSYDIRAAVSGIVVPGTDYGTKYIAVMITCTAEAA